jgi:hypothetical protein
MCAGAAMVHCQCQCQWLQRQQSHWPQRGWGRAQLLVPESRGWLRVRTPSRTGLLKRQPGDSGPPGLGLRPVAPGAARRDCQRRGLRVAGRGRPWGAGLPVAPSQSYTVIISQCPGPLGLPGLQAHGLHEVRPQRDSGLRRRLVPDRTCSADSDCPHGRLPVSARAIASARLEKGCVCQ